jgi:L-seryl-tRNA(Ser) seleniumtransferase
MVIASGDKLLGGPQAGLMFGRYDLIERCRAHPLARAMRVDKTRIAALNATLEIHRSGRARSDVPIWRMLTADVDELRSRTEALAARVDGAVVAEGVSVPGGGSAPGAGIEGPVLHLHADRPDDATKQLRAGKIPLIVRVEDNRLVVDLRTVDPTDDDYLVEALRAC